MLQVNNIYKEYKVGNESVPVLNGISLDIKQGEFVAIVGPSGCGKTTLLNIIAGIDHCSKGEIKYLNESTERFNDNDWSLMRKNIIGYIFQNFNLIEYLTAQENIELALSFGGVKKNTRKKRAKELLEVVGLKDRCKHFPSQLSGGQKQRVAIARALANNPNIILADEPTGAVDSVTAKEIMALLKRINRERGVTVIMITHDVLLAAEAARKITIFDGKVMEDDIITSSERKIPDLSNKKLPNNVTFLTSVNIALKNLSNRKKRTILTSIGTAIGILGVLLMFGMGTGAKSRISEEVNSFIVRDAIYVDAGDKVIDEAVKDEIITMENVKNVIESYQFDVTYDYNGFIGIATASSLPPLENTLDNVMNLVNVGSLPSSNDSNEIVIPRSMAQELVGEDNNLETIIGKKLIVLFSLNGSKALTYQIKYECTICGLSDNSIFGLNLISVPYLKSIEIAKKSAEDQNYVATYYTVRVNDEKKIDQTKELISAMGYEASTDADDLKTIDMYLNMITIILMLISGVAVVVSAIMITLVMYMSVIEQMRVIGVMRAIGSRKKDIHRIFITEGGIIGFFAGVVGVILATLCGILINMIIKVAFPEVGFDLYQITIMQIIYCIIFSIFLSIVASYLPARKASKLDTVIALGFYQ